MKPLAFFLLIVMAVGCSKIDSSKDSKGTLETKLMRGGSIWSLDWSPDGRYIAAGDASGLLRIYDANSYALTNILTGFKATINGIHWSPDGKKIVASGAHEDPRILIWDLEKKSRIILDVHKRQVRSVRWSPRGKYFASTSHDGTIRIWTPNGEFVKMFTGANMGCVGIDWLDEDKIAASCWDNTIRIYTVSGKEDELLIENGDHRRKAVLSVDWHPDGNLFATGDYGNDEDTVHAVKIWTDRGELKFEMTSHQKEIRALSWNKEGTILASGGETVRLWNQNGDLLKVFNANTSPIWSLDWNEDGTRIVTGHNDGKIRIWNTDGELLHLFDGHATKIIARSFSRDSTRLLLGFSDGKISYYDFKKMTTTTIVANTRSITNIVWNPDQQYFAASSFDGTLSIWEFEQPNSIALISYFGIKIYAKNMAWSPDGEKLACLQNDGTLSVWSPSGEFQYARKVDEEKANVIQWKDNQPSVMSTDSNPEYYKTIHIVKDNKTLELIPLHNNQFALLDSLGNVMYGNKADFIFLTIKNEDGFAKIKSL